jgi:bis(5'-nucleosyl)-tetraphosphatase (symmetrical)
MSNYAIGDLQGCHDALRRLLDRLAFAPSVDRLWLTGDLVNRGPDSLATLRFIKNLGDAATSVLGNHDLHALAVAHGGRKGRRDTLDELLGAPDRDELFAWLRGLPLLAETGGWIIVHAGLAPQWDIAQARRCAREAEAALRGRRFTELLTRMYGDQPDRWDEGLEGLQRLRFIVNCFTRLRYCDAGGRMAFKPKGAPGTQPEGLLPWFTVPGRRSAGADLIFGHWSTLGRVHWPEARVYGLDSGAVWGGALTALRLEDRSLIAVDGSTRPADHAAAGDD